METELLKLLAMQPMTRMQLSTTLVLAMPEVDKIIVKLFNQERIRQEGNSPSLSKRRVDGEIGKWAHSTYSQQMFYRKLYLRGTKN